MTLAADNLTVHKRIDRFLLEACRFESGGYPTLAAENLWRAANMAASASDYGRAYIYMEAVSYTH